MRKGPWYIGLDAEWGGPCPALHLQSLIRNFPTIAFGDPKEGYACDENFLATTHRRL